MTSDAAASRAPLTSKHRLRVHISPEILAEALGLPPRHHLVALETTNDPFGVLAICEGPDFPESPIDAVSPIGRLHVTVHRDADTGDVVHVEREVRWFDGDEELVSTSPNYLGDGHTVGHGGPCPACGGPPYSEDHLVRYARVKDSQRLPAPDDEGGAGS